MPFIDPSLRTRPRKVCHHYESIPPSPVDSGAKPVPIALSRRDEHIGGIDSPNRWLNRENQRGIDPSLRRVFDNFRPPFATSEHYIKLTEAEKDRKLNDLLDALDVNQVVIFVKSVSRAAELNKLLSECNFPSICIHSGMNQEERLKHYKGFKEGQNRILVATDLVGRGIDIECVNIVINYDMPDSADTYLHRVGRAGMFGTKGLTITFVSSASDSDVLNDV